MFPFPQNTHWGSPQVEPATSAHSFAFLGRQPRQTVPRVAKSQSLRLALAERMCDIEIQRPATIHAPARGWQPGCATQGDVINPPGARLFPCWETMGYGDNLLGIQAFSKACMSASAVGTAAFTNTTFGGKPTRLGRSLLEVMPLIEHFARSQCADIRFDPYVRFAIDAFQEAGLLEGTAMGPMGQPARWFERGYAVLSAATLCNAYVDEIRRRGRQVGTGRDMQRHEDMHAAQAREMRSYLTNVAKRHGTCDVKRVELCMHRNSLQTDREEYKFMVEAAMRFLRSVKQQFGAAIVANIHKIDRGATSRYLVHVLIAVDGPSKVSAASRPS